MLGSAENFAFYIRFFENFLYFAYYRFDEFSPFGKFAVNIYRQILVCLGVYIFKAQIFKFAFNLRNPESAGKRRVNIQRFVRHPQLPFLRQEIQRAHIVKSVGEFYDYNPYILRHRNENLFEVFSLFFFPGLEFDFIKFRYTQHKTENLFAERLFNIRFRNGSVFEYVVQKRGRRGIIIHTEIHQNFRNRAWVSKILFARSALLPRMSRFREVERAINHFAFFTVVRFFYLT